MPLAGQPGLRDCSAAPLAEDEHEAAGADQPEPERGRCSDAGVGPVEPVSHRRAHGEGRAASVSRLDADSGEIDTPIALPRSPGGHLFGVLAGLSRQQIALTHDAVWVINGDQTVSRIDPKSNRVAETIRHVSAENIAAGEGQVWVTEGSSIAQIDPSSNRVSRRIELEVDTLSGLAVGAGAVWVTDPFGGKVWRVSVEPALVKRSIPLETWVAAITFSDGLVWAANEIADEVYRFDPRTNGATVVRGISAPRSIDAADSSVWVTAAAPPSSDAALPSPVCGPLFYSGPGSPATREAIPSATSRATRRRRRRALPTSSAAA